MSCVFTLCAATAGGRTTYENALRYYASYYVNVVNARSTSNREPIVFAVAVFAQPLAIRYSNPFAVTDEANERISNRLEHI